MIEHELHPKTVEQIKSLVSFIETAPDHPQWLDHFAIFCELGKHPCIKDARLSQTMAAQMGAEKCEGKQITAGAMIDYS